MRKNILISNSSELLKNIKDKYYNNFLYTFLIYHKFDVMKNLCVDIAQKDIEIIKKDNGNIKYTDLLTYDIPKVLSDILLITKNDFDTLNQMDFEKVKDLDADQALSTLCEMVLKKKLKKSNSLRNKRVKYLKKIIRGNKTASVQVPSFDDLSLGNTEKDIRTLLYLNMAQRIMDEEYRNLNLSYNACELCRNYKKKYIDQLKKYPEYFDFLFDGLSDPNDISQMCNNVLDNYRVTDSWFGWSEKRQFQFANSCHKALMKTFSNDKERFIQFCESNQKCKLSPNTKKLSLCSWSFAIFMHVLAFFEFFVGSIFDPACLILFFIAGTNHTVWLLFLTFFGVGGTLAWIWFPWLFIWLSTRHLSYVEELTPLKGSYNNYLNRKYPILTEGNNYQETKNNQNRFLLYKQNVINQKNELDKAKKILDKNDQSNGNNLSPTTVIMKGEQK